MAGEAALHEELKPYLAARREWYRADPELLARIAALPSSGEQQRETNFRVVTENDRVRDPWAS